MYRAEKLKPTVNYSVRKRPINGFHNLLFGHINVDDVSNCAVVRCRGLFYLVWVNWRQLIWKISVQHVKLCQFNQPLIGKSEILLNTTLMGDLLTWHKFLRPSGGLSRHIVPVASYPWAVVVETNARATTREIKLDVSKPGLFCEHMVPFWRESASSRYCVPKRHLKSREYTDQNDRRVISQTDTWLSPRWRSLRSALEPDLMAEVDSYSQQFTMLFI